MADRSHAFAELKRRYFRNVAALERSDNVARRGHAFARLKRGYSRNVAVLERSDNVADRGYPRRTVITQESAMRPGLIPPILPA